MPAHSPKAGDAGLHRGPPVSLAAGSAEPFEHHGHALPAADGHGFEPELLVVDLRRVDQRGGDPGAGHAERVTHRDGAAVDVQLVDVDAQVAVGRDHRPRPSAGHAWRPVSPSACSTTAGSCRAPSGGYPADPQATGPSGRTRTQPVLSPSRPAAPPPYGSATPSPPPMPLTRTRTPL